MKRIIHHEADTGITQYFHGDDQGNIAIQTVQNVNDIIENNKTQFNATEKHTRWGEGQKIASIPLSIFYAPWFQEIRRDEKKLRAFLNDPNNRAFRTRQGTV